MDYSKERSVKFLRGAAQSLHDENRRLRQERAAVAARLAEVEAGLEHERAARLAAEVEAERQRIEREAAEAEAERQRAERDELAKLLDDAQKEMASLREKLAMREQALYGKKTERRPSAEKTAGTKEEKKKPKGQRKGHGPTTQPDIKNKVDVTHTLVGDKLKCEKCGGQLATLGACAEEAELIAIEERKIVLERHLRKKYQCPCCNTGVTTAPGPVKLIPGGRYALSFTIEVAFMKYLAHLPLERQAQMMRHEGLRVTTASLFEQLDLLATALAPTYQAIWAVLQQESVLRADETPWAVLANQYTANERFYAWCAVGSQYVGYRLLDTRSAEGAATILGAFAGTLMVDGLTSYPAAAKAEPGAAPKFLVANCHAHARRKFVEIEKHYPDESRFVIALYKKLYAIEREGQQPGADLAALRRERSKPLVDALFAWAKEQQKRPDILPNSGLAKALAYLVNHETGLRVFLDDPAVPIDNNEAERAMRAPVLGRKNHYGSRSRRGTEVAAILYTLIESAKRVGVSPKAYLMAAVEHALRKAGAVLLPDEFKRQLDAIRAMPPPDAA